MEVLRLEFEEVGGDMEDVEYDYGQDTRGEVVDCDSDSDDDEDFTEKC